MEIKQKNGIILKKMWQGYNDVFASNLHYPNVLDYRCTYLVKRTLVFKQKQGCNKARDLCF